MRIEPLESRIAPALLVVSNLLDSGAGSLRSAILASNFTPEADTITFIAAGTITPLSALPDIAGQVTIDGTTAPGFAGQPVIALNGVNAGQSAGLTVTGTATIKSLAVGGFAGAGILFNAATGTNLVQTCFVGTNATGTLPVPNGSGVVLFNTANATIGGSLISGNTGDGIVIFGTSSRGNTVVGNGIGLDVTGQGDLGNGGAGIFIGDAPANIIGTSTSSHNTIGGNGGAGIELSGSGSAQNSIRGNVIGGNPAATIALPNDGDGIFIHNGASATAVGGTVPDLRNYIGGNRGFGVRIEDASLNTIQSNFIGAAISGTAARANGLGGVAILATSHDNLIGGDHNTEAINLISGNVGPGVLIAGDASHNIVAGNFIGTVSSTASALPNTVGISIEGHAFENLIGGSEPNRNIISGNTGDGIRISSDGGGQFVQNNFIGLGPNNTTVPNGANGILLSNTAGNVIGGDAAHRNFIGGNLEYGIALSSANSNTIAGNFVGIGLDAITAAGNHRSGIGLFDSADNTIGGVFTVGNLFSANFENGIFLQGSGTHGNMISGNIVGTDLNVTVARPNSIGIAAQQSGPNFIGDVDPQKTNVISGNRFDGVVIAGSDGFIIQNNRIGVGGNVGGALPNGSNGIRLDLAFGNLIGGPTQPAANYISGNGAAGIAINGGGNNTIQHNVIGLDVNVATALPNGEGMRIASSNNLIGGGTNEGNYIAGNRGSGVVILGSGNRISANGIGIAPGAAPFGNGGNGIEITGVGNVVGRDVFNIVAANGGAGILIHAGARAGDSVGNELRGNILGGNAGLGIDLEPGGATPNDAGDFDDGANNRQNFPVLTSASISGGQIAVAGTLNSAANTTFTIEFFSNFGTGQALFFLGSASVISDANGNAALAGTFPAPLNGQRVVAIATSDTTHDSSEISPSILPSTDNPGISIADAATDETDRTAFITVSLDAPGNNAVTVQYTTLDGTALNGLDYTTITGSLTFLPGETSKTISVAMLNDSLIEPVENFAVKLSAPTGGGTLADADATSFIVSNDDTSLRIRGGKVATWRDVDGDLVTLTATHAVLDAGDFALVPVGLLGGEQLVALHIGDDGARRLGLKFVAKPEAGTTTGDGFVNVGFLDAVGADLGAVSIDGDLGRIVVGDNNLAGKTIKSLVARSIGRLGTSTQTADGNLVSIFIGRAKSVVIHGDLAGALAFVGDDANLAAGAVTSLVIDGDVIGGADGVSGKIGATGSIGTLTIAGKLRGGSGGPTGIFSGGTIGALSIGGVLGASADHPVFILAQGIANPSARTALAIGKISIAGSVENADVRAGFSILGVAASHSVAIGVVSVRGDWLASSLSAGIETGADGFYGDAQDTVIVGGNSIASSIAKIVIHGRIAGTDNAVSATDRFGFTASNIGKFRLGATSVTLSKTQRDDLSIGTTGDVRIREA